MMPPSANLRVSILPCLGNELPGRISSVELTTLKIMPPWELGISLAAVQPRSPADRVLKRGQWQALLCDGNVTRSVLQTARPS